MAKTTQKDYEMTLKELSNTSDIKAFLKGLKNRKKKKKKKPGAEQGKKITQKDFATRVSPSMPQEDILFEMKSMRDAAKKLKGNKKKKKKVNQK